MATFRKRGNKWSYRIDIGVDPFTKKRRQVQVSGFDSKEEAKAAATKHQYELDNGTHVQEKDISFSDLVDSWLEYYESSVKISTVRVRKHESNHLKEEFKLIRAREISKKMYQDALLSLSKKLSESTLSGVHTTGRMIFKYGIEFDFIKQNPTQYAKVPKKRKTVEQLEAETEVPKYLEKEELAVFLDYAKKHGLDGDYAIFLLLAYTGIRAGELCALKWTDLKEDTISITKTYYNPTNDIKNYTLLTPKTITSKRKIELSSTVLNELKTHKDNQNEWKMLHRKTYHKKDFIFEVGERYPGYPLYIKRIESRMRRLLKLAELDEKLTPHSLRHTHTSLLAEAGVGLQEIMERLGHKDDDTTKSVYMHVTKTMKKEASHKFDQLMKNL
jgi:integrase